MLKRIHELTDQLVEATTKLYQVDLEKQRAEYAYLQSQDQSAFPQQHARFDQRHRDRERKPGHLRNDDRVKYDVEI